MRQKRSHFYILMLGLVIAGVLVGVTWGTCFMGAAGQDAPGAIGTPAVVVITPNGGEYWQETHSIRWTALDPQNDPLTYSIYYSTNGGSTWIQLSTDLTEPVYVWDTTTVENGAAYLIQVKASDGQNTGVDISDAPFEITNELSFVARLTSQLPSQMTVSVVVIVISVLGVLGATLKTVSMPPLRGKRSWNDFLQRLLWYLLNPFIWIFGHVIYGPTLRRLKQKDVTTNAKRQAILHLLKVRGLAHLREMARAVGIGIFGLKWHLQVLDDFGYVRHRKVGRHLVYYLKEFGAKFPSLVEPGFLFKQKTTRAIIDHLQRHPRASQSEIAHAIGVSNTTVRRHALKLTTHALLEAHSEEGEVRYVLPEAKKDVIISLLRQVQPED